METKVEYFISFDCGNKTLAYVVGCRTPTGLRICSDSGIHKPRYQYQPIKGILDVGKIGIDILDMNVIDLLDGAKLKKSNKDVIIKKLVDVLNGIKLFTTNTNLSSYAIYIENQQKTNPDTLIIQSSLSTYYTGKGCNITSVPPSLKNTIAFSEAGLIQNFYAKYSTNHAANKAQATYAINEYLTYKKQKSPVSKALTNHIGDAFMQVVGYHSYIG